MRKSLISSVIAVALLSSAAAVVAQQMPSPPGKKDAALVTGGSYTVDPGHSQVLFAYNHMGFTNNMGLIAGPTGTLTLDPKKPSAAKVSVEIPIANLKTAVAALDEHLMKPEFFDAAKFPTAKFESTGVKVDGDDAEISGNLTIKGITKPVILDAEFYGAGKGPAQMGGKENVGFTATTTIKRSDFGMGYGVPIVSDAVELKITVGFQK
jgi:polyisoprenoid-binding protein YceI